MASRASLAMRAVYISVGVITGLFCMFFVTVAHTSLGAVLQFTGHPHIVHQVITEGRWLQACVLLLIITVAFPNRYRSLSLGIRCMAIISAVGLLLYWKQVPLDLSPLADNQEGSWLWPLELMAISLPLMSVCLAVAGSIRLCLVCRRSAPARV